MTARPTLHAAPEGVRDSDHGRAADEPAPTQVPTMHLAPPPPMRADDGLPTVPPPSGSVPTRQGACALRPRPRPETEPPPVDAPILAMVVAGTRRDGVPGPGARTPRPAGSQRVRRASVPMDGMVAAPPERGPEVVGDRRATPEQRRAMWGQSIDTVTIEDQTPSPKHRRVAGVGAARATAELEAITAAEPLPTDFIHGVQ